jgi:hypothetical protein
VNLRVQDKSNNVNQVFDWQTNAERSKTGKKHLIRLLHFKPFWGQSCEAFLMKSELKVPGRDKTYIKETINYSITVIRAQATQSLWFSLRHGKFLQKSSMSQFVCNIAKCFLASKFYHF